MRQNGKVRLKQDAGLMIICKLEAKVEGRQVQPAFILCK